MGEAKRILYHEGLNPRGIGSSSTISTNFYPIRRKIGFSYANGRNPQCHSKKKSHWTQFPSLWRWGLWPISCSLTSTQWRIWPHCLDQELFFYMISQHIRRSTYAVIYTTSWPKASPRGTWEQSCNSQVLS